MSVVNKVISCDTSFFIRLLNSEDPLNRNAVDYFQYFLDEKYQIRVSTIAIAEFCVQGSADMLPIKSMLVSPFNYNHAIFAGQCARVLFNHRSKGAVEVDNRIVIANDVKIMTQAQMDGSALYVTSDRKCKRMYDVLRKEGKLMYDFIDISVPCSQQFGTLPLNS